MKPQVWLRGLTAKRIELPTRSNGPPALRAVIQIGLDEHGHDFAMSLSRGKGAMYAKWITPSFCARGEKEGTGIICLLRTNGLAVVTQFEIMAAPY